MSRKLPALVVAAALLVGPNRPSAAGSAANMAYLTIYDAGIAEILETRTLELQKGLNTVEWRSLMPKANVRTIRVTAEDAEILRQDLSYDGADVKNEKSPVLHLTILNPGASGPRRVQVDYLAPGLDWHGDYALVLDPAPDGAPPTSAELNSWVSVHNQTGGDLAPGAVDLVAGEISLLLDDHGPQPDGYAAQAVNVYRRHTTPEFSADISSAEGGRISAFHRFRLGRDLTLNANAPVNRFPLFQQARTGITQRIVFENEYGRQTLARGGFTLLPRGLEVRLVSKNMTGAPMPAGQVTIYARTGELSQVVGQDRIALTPPGGEFGLTQGRSSTVFGTRRVVERRQVTYKREDGNSREKLVTRVEVVVANRGTVPVEAYVREGIESYAENHWNVSASSAAGEKLGANTVQFQVAVPAGGQTTLSYTVETR